MNEIDDPCGRILVPILVLFLAGVVGFRRILRIGREEEIDGLSIAQQAPREKEVVDICRCLFEIRRRHCYQFAVFPPAELNMFRQRDIAIVVVE